MERVLCIDVGNSRVKCGLFERGKDDRCLPVVINSVAALLETDFPWSHVLQWQSEWDSTVARIAGSNPEHIDRLVQQWPTGHIRPARQLAKPSQIPIETRLDSPDKVGIDRLLTAVAANQIRAAEQPAIVIDTGTATTIDLLAADGFFEGGAILPGVSLAAKSLHEYTSLLPLLPREELVKPIPSPLGRNTADAMRSGIYLGHVGSIRHLVAGLRDLVPDQEPLVLLTGGAAGVLRLSLPEFRYEPRLALQGLALIKD